jgi:DNA-binding YbaB/EbfC family protein
MQPGMGFDFQELLAQAQQMQDRMQDAQRRLAEAHVTGTAGGGLVTATVTGTGDLVGLDIAPEVVDPNDIETLVDLIVAAVRDARSEADDLAADELDPMTGGFGQLGGGLGLPGLPGSG